MALSRDKHKTPAFLEKASREQKKIQDKLHLTLQNDIYRLFEEGTYSDVTLPCGATPMLIHRAILEARVPGFLQIICPDGVPNKVVLDVIAAEDLRLFIQCVYKEDNLLAAWEMFLSHLTVPDEQVESGASTGTASEGVTGEHSQNDQEVSQVAQGGGTESAPETSIEVEEACQSHHDAENVGTAIGTGMNGEFNGMSGNQTVALGLEGTHRASPSFDEALAGQEEDVGNDCGESASQPEREETNCSHVALTNGISQPEVPIDDCQGTATASVMQLDVCQYVSMDVPMGVIPKPFEQIEKPAPDLSGSEGASHGPVFDEKFMTNCKKESGFSELDDAEAVIVDGVASLAVNGPTMEGTHGEEYRYKKPVSLHHGDDTSGTLRKSSVIQTDSEGEKPPSSSQDARVSNGEELHQFVERLHSLPVPSGTLAENLMHLLDSDCSLFSDFALVSSDGTRIPAHRFILHCRCEFFAAMLGGSWIEAESNEMQLKGISKLVVDAILKFMYGGVASLPDDVNLRDLLGAADMYGLQGLKEVTAFHLKRDWCHLFHKPLCAECLSLVPHCYALCESYGLPDLSQTCLRWMSKNMDRFWVQKTFSSLPQEMLENCSKDVVETLTVKNVTEVLFQLDKVKLSLPRGQSSWAEPVKEITSKTWKRVLQFAADNFRRIIDGQTFADKYLKGMGWKKDVMEALFRKVVAVLSLEKAGPNFRAVWRLYKRELTEREKKEGKPTVEEEWNPDAYAAMGVLYDKMYNYVVSNASYIVHTETFKDLPEDLQKQVRKDAVYVDEDLSKTTKKPVLSSSQRPKSAQVRRTRSHPLRASSPASSASSASSVASAPSSSRSHRQGGGPRTGSAQGAGISSFSSTASASSSSNSHGRGGGGGRTGPIRRAGASSTASSASVPSSSQSREQREGRTGSATGVGAPSTSTASAPSASSSHERGRGAARTGSATGTRASSTSSTASSGSQGRGGGGARTVGAMGAGTSRNTGGPPRSAGGMMRDTGGRTDQGARGRLGGSDASSRGAGSGSDRGAGCRTARGTCRGSADGRGSTTATRGNGTSGSRGVGSGVAARNEAQRSARPNGGQSDDS